MTATIILGALLSACPGLPPYRAQEYAKVVVIEGGRRGVDGVLVASLMAEESGCRRRAVNARTGAAGLMQIAPIHHQPGVDPLGWRWNIRTGIRILAEKLAECVGSAHGALRRYNGLAGCGASAFSRRVVARWRRLGGVVTS